MIGQNYWAYRLISFYWISFCRVNKKLMRLAVDSRSKRQSLMYDDSIPRSRVCLILIVLVLSVILIEIKVETGKYSIIRYATSAQMNNML